MQEATRFVTTTDGVRIGYCTHGSGPPLLFIRGWISHLVGMWELPDFRAYIEALAEHYTVIRYDTRGQGVSQRRVDDVDFDALTLDVEALVDALGIDDVVLYGQTFGGPIAVTYAARHPYRVSKMILDGTYARSDLSDPHGQESFLQILEQLWPDSLSLIAQLTNPESARKETLRNDWSGRALTGEMAARLYRLAGTVDITDVLGDITVPTLVVHRRDSRSIPLGMASRLAAGIPDASLVVVEGAAHNPWEGDPQPILDAIGAFLGVELRYPELAAEPAAPVAILFTDMEASTALTSKLGDERAQELVKTHDVVVRSAIAEHGGSEVKHTGDGVMAEFPSISQAVTCAVDVQRGLRAHEAPFRLKIGIDAGEPLRQGGDITGTVVQSARRIVDRAEPGQILVSDVVRKLVAGKSFEFTDRGRASLKGLPERVRLYEVAWDDSPVGT